MNFMIKGIIIIEPHLMQLVVNAPCVGCAKLFHTIVKPLGKVLVLVEFIFY